MESAQQARQQLAEDVGMVDSDNAMQVRDSLPQQLAHRSDDPRTIIFTQH
jgi:hypothetical protein